MNLHVAAAGLGVLLGAAAPVAGVVLAEATPVFATTDQNNQGNNQQGNNQGNNQNGKGGGVATPELPSGILVGFGLIPLAVAAFALRRRQRALNSD